MPYDNINSLPEWTKKYSDKLQRQYLHVWNSVYAKVLKETGNAKEAEQRAFQGAASVLKGRFNKKNSMEKNTREDYFSMLVDSWIGNIKK